MQIIYTVIQTVKHAVILLLNFMGQIIFRTHSQLCLRDIHLMAFFLDNVGKQTPDKVNHSRLVIFSINLFLL